jgi:predicted nuclease with TOPRIM domain
MNLNELELKAKRFDEMPDGLTQPEQLFFMSLRYLYQSYKNRQIDIEQAKREKSKLIDEFASANIAYRADTEMIRRLNNCGTLLSEAHKSGCETCDRMARLITGIL